MGLRLTDTEKVWIGILHLGDAIALQPRQK